MQSAIDQRRTIAMLCWWIAGAVAVLALAVLVWWRRRPPTDERRLDVPVGRPYTQREKRP